MKIVYHPIEACKPRKIQATLQELALNIITDWMPGSPSSLSFGFLDLLANIMERKEIDGESTWTIRPEAGDFEKQWKQVTSWLLGVAFCRKIVNLKGYHWWAPVSVFSNPKVVGRIKDRNWPSSFPSGSCFIKKPDNPDSNLMPDYVLAKYDFNKNKYRIAFAESKGCKDSLENKTDPPDSWRNQSRNAEFYYKGSLYSPTQNLIIATRVNPSAIRVKTRQIYVREWNSEDKTHDIPEEAFISLITYYYAIIFKLMGMDANSELLFKKLELSIKTFSEEDGQEIPDEAIYEPTLFERADSELKQIGHSSNLPISLPEKYKGVPFGNNKLNIGFLDPLINLIYRLQGENIDGLNKTLEGFSQEIKYMKKSFQEHESLYIREDGMAVLIAKK